MATRYDTEAGPDTEDRGDEYAAYMITSLHKFGIEVHMFHTAREQIGIGESREGYEFKLDMRCTDTNRLSIEVAEKAKMGNAVWAESGILRDDNTVFYVQGNFIRSFIFLKRDLVSWHCQNCPLVIEKKKTIRTFYLGFIDAEQMCLFEINGGRPVWQSDVKLARAAVAMRRVHEYIIGRWP